MIIVFLLLLILLCIIWLKRVCEYENKEPYRIGNVIGYWWTQHNLGRSGESIAELCEPHKNTFAYFLFKNNPSEATGDVGKRALESWQWWWENMGKYKANYPEFNTSIRNAIKSYGEWEPIHMDDDTCVIHYRIGDFLHRSVKVSVDELIGAMDGLPRSPKRIEVINGGINHLTDDDLINRSNNLMDELMNKLKAKYPRADIVTVENTTPDSDFYRMVKAPMLVTGVGSFGTMAAAANENFRLSSGKDVNNEGYHYKGLIYENWYGY